MAYEELKDRLLIASGISAHDVSLGLAEDEASRYVVMEIGKYDGAFTTISGNTVPNDAMLDIAAGVYKKRRDPKDIDAEEGWWGSGQCLGSPYHPMR